MKLFQKENTADTKFVYQTFPFPNCGSSTGSCGTTPTNVSIYQNIYSSPASLITLGVGNGDCGQDVIMRTDPLANTLSSVYPFMSGTVASPNGLSKCFTSCKLCGHLVGLRHNPMGVSFTTTLPYDIVGGPIGDIFEVGNYGTGNSPLISEPSQFGSCIYTTKGSIITFTKNTNLYGLNQSGGPTIPVSARNIYIPSGTAAAPSYTVSAAPASLSAALSFAPWCSQNFWNPEPGVANYPSGFLYYYYAKPDILVVHGSSDLAHSKIVVLNTSTPIPTVLSSAVLPTTVAFNYSTATKYTLTGVSPSGAYIVFNSTYTSISFSSGVVPSGDSPAYFYESPCGVRSFGWMDGKVSTTITSAPGMPGVTSTAQNYILPLAGAAYSSEPRIYNQLNGISGSGGPFVSTIGSSSISTYADATPPTVPVGSAYTYSGLSAKIWSDFTSDVQVFATYNAFNRSTPTGTDCSVSEAIHASTSSKTIFSIGMQATFNGVPINSTSSTSHPIMIPATDTLNLCYTIPSTCLPSGAPSVSVSVSDPSFTLFYKA